MAKLMTFVMITVGLMVLLNMSGLNPNPFYDLSSLINFQSTWFYIGIFAALGLLVAVTGIRIGTFGTATTSIGITAAAALPLVFFIGNLTSIISSTTTEWLKYVLFAIISPILFGYILALFSWAKGEDS